MTQINFKPQTRLQLDTKTTKSTQLPAPCCRPSSSSHTRLSFYQPWQHRVLSPVTNQSINVSKMSEKQYLQKFTQILT